MEQKNEEIILWVACDLMGSFFALWMLPKVLLPPSIGLMERPERYLKIGVVMLVLVRSSTFYSLCQKNLGSALRNSYGEYVVLLMKYFVVGAVVLHVVLVLFGAPFLELVDRTFVFACLLSTLSVMQVSFSSSGGNYPVFEGIRTILLNQYCSTKVDQILLAQTCGAILGTWLGAIPIPLDWDRPWQAWPITLVVGSSGGFLVGTLCGTGYVVYKDVSKKAK